jgi:hypothetical protein
MTPLEFQTQIMSITWFRGDAGNLKYEEQINVLKNIIFLSFLLRSLVFRFKSSLSRCIQCDFAYIIVNVDTNLLLQIKFNKIHYSKAVKLQT